MQEYSNAVYCHPNPAANNDSIIALQGHVHMLADKEPRLPAPCFICHDNTSEQRCAIVLRGYPTDVASDVSSVTATAVCLSHAHDLADTLDQPYVSDGLRELGIWADLDAIESRCVVCASDFGGEEGVIGLGDVRLHLGCASSFIETLRGLDEHADELLGATL